MMQLETKYQKHVNGLQNFHRFSWNSRKNVAHITKFFGILIFEILPDNRHTKYPQNYSTKCYNYSYFLSTAKTSLTDNEKKWWKFFCGDQLERIFISSWSGSLPSVTGFGWRLNYPACKERCPESTSQVYRLFLEQLQLTVLHKLQLYSPLWQVSTKKLPSSGSDPRLLSHRLRWKSASSVDPPKTRSRERQTDKSTFPLKKIRRYSEPGECFFFHFHWESNSWTALIAIKHVTTCFMVMRAAEVEFWWLFWWCFDTQFLCCKLHKISDFCVPIKCNLSISFLVQLPLFNQIILLEWSFLHIKFVR
jgi:hypothetical protein